MFGTVETSRAGYGQEGVDSLHPMDGELNLPSERYSLELRRLVAEEAVKNSFDETVETIAKTTGGHVPKRQVEELAQISKELFKNVIRPLGVDYYGTGRCLALYGIGK